MINFRTGYNVEEFDPNEISDKTGLRCPSLDEVEPGQFEWLADQSFKEDSDINTIVKRFGLTGELPENLNMPVGGDFTHLTDFKSAMDLIRRSEEEFLRIPPDIRAQFENDPGRLIAFLDDEKNREKAVEIGLIPKPPEKTRDAVQAIDELAAVLTPKA